MYTSKKRGKKRKLALLMEDLFEEETPSVVESVQTESNLVSAPTSSSQTETPASVCEHQTAKNLNCITAEIGLHGLILLVELLDYIPSNFLTYRLQYIADILGVLLDKQVHQKELESFIDECNRSEDTMILLSSIIKMPLDVLWKASLKSNKPCTIFLSPPVDSCLKCSKKLTTHNRPSTVVCYTENGPLVGAKIILRCESCGINYRYIIMV